MHVRIYKAYFSRISLSLKNSRLHSQSLVTQKSSNHDARRLSHPVYHTTLLTWPRYVHTYRNAVSSGNTGGWMAS